MNTRLTLIVVAIATVLSACASPAGDSEPARQALMAFFGHLSQEEYAAADALYGGDYETLTSLNPDLDPNDHAALWANGCQINGLQCLPVRSAALKEQADDTFVFTVEFSHADGTLFARGPCCGAEATQMPPSSQFEYHVRQTAQGQFRVLDMPVYVP